jgi:asparagine synthase (glutamine-hydrolysing)
MCGIIGIIRPQGTPCLDELRRGLDRLRHRGPDGRGEVDVDGIAAFGHARLAILDLTPAGAQPMRDASGRYVITYNGEVYNFRLLRSELEALGHSFRSTSDTEVILAAYAHWGTGAFARFEGMFALGIWDRRDRRLVLARDRLGEKPLYYARDGEWIVFASELTALLATGRPGMRPPSTVVWSDYLALGYVPGPLTAHPNVLKLEPASYVVFEGDHLVVPRRYWDYSAAFRSKYRGTDRDAVHELGDALRRSVASQLVSDVPVGALLSGGLDSSTIVAMMHGELPYPLHTFSVGFEPHYYDETKDALLVAKKFGTLHHEHRIGLLEGAAIARKAVDVYDEPFSDTSLVPMVAVAEEAARHVKVALSGDGADEILAGYETYRADRVLSWLSHVPAPLRSRVSAAVRRHVSEETSRKTTWRFKARQFARGLPLDRQHAHAAWRTLHTYDEIVRSVGAEHAEELREHPPFRVFERHYREVPDLDPLDQHLYVDAKTWLVDDILVKVDRAAMASSLETRAPFLAREVVEIAASLPVHLKLGARRGKIALRRIAETLLPVETTRKRKSGFSAPVNAWFLWTDDNEYRRFNEAVRDWRLDSWAAAFALGEVGA